MEIMEVMSIHVALPVIGVLICAFLVFAFGFRSPVQPPSFDFSEDKKNQKKTKKTKGKGQTNGHIVQVKEETPKLLTPKATKQNTANKPKSPTNEKKNKKADKSTKYLSERLKPKQEEEIQDDSGWSVAFSKKKDKIRSKREEKEKEFEGEKQLTLEDIGFDSKPEDIPAEIPTQQDPPQEQRTTKKKRQSKKSEGETTTESEEPKVEDVVPTPPEPMPAKPEIKTDDKPATTNKKSKNKSDKVSEEKTDSKPAQDPTPANSNKNNKKSKSKKLSADAEEFQPMVYDNKPKAQASPKKPRNKNNSQSQESEEVSKVEEIKEVIKPVVKEIEEKTVEPVKNIIKEEKTKLEDKKESDSENKTEQKPVFDELAATPPTWQDAPKTKKKKARREN